MIRVPVERKKADGSYVYPRRIGDNVPDAQDVLRRALTAAADHSVVIVQVGFSTNLARLLASDRELVQRKVRLLSTMFGHFPIGSPNTTSRPISPPRRNSSPSGRRRSSSAASRSARRCSSPPNRSSTISHGRRTTRWSTPIATIRRCPTTGRRGTSRPCSTPSDPRRTILKCPRPAA